MINLLYIHKLADLNMKSAEVESFCIIRDLKQRHSFPIPQQEIYNYLSEYFISKDELDMMEDSLDVIEPTIKMINRLLEEKNPVYEAINLQRAVQILEKIPESLSKNLNYFNEIYPWQDELVKETTITLNIIPSIDTDESRFVHSEKINRLFEKLLRNNEFCFNYRDLIHESHTHGMNLLNECIPKGYFFHLTLEEDVNKVSWNEIKKRIPQEKLSEVEEIQKMMVAIKKGVDKAYSLNMNMVNCSIILYSYIKWISSQA